MSSDARISRLVSFSAVATIACLVALGVACLRWPQEAGRAWYFGAYIGLHISLGCAALLFIGDLCGGRWNEQLAPMLDAGRRMIIWLYPLFAVSFLWLGHLFPWTDNLGPQGSLLPLAKSEYLSVGFFLVRMGLFGVIFVILCFAAGLAAKNIRARHRGEIRPSRGWSSVGIVLYAFSSVVFHTDALMSIDPHWFSTGFPVVMMASQALSAYCVCLFCHAVLACPPSPAPSYFGNMILATLLFWLYVAFVQFLIIWLGNLTEDIGYYLHRATPFWKGVSVFLFVFGFVVPFLLLLRREIKRQLRPLGWVACLLALCQALYLGWVMLPSWWSPMQAVPAALCSLALVGFLGLWLAIALPRYRKELRHA